jgi:hypothetical protein
MAMEPIVRIHVLMTAGYLILDSVFTMDAQVCRQLTAEALVEEIAPENLAANPINIIPGPGGTGTTSGKSFHFGDE